MTLKHYIAVLFVAVAGGFCFRLYSENSQHYRCEHAAIFVFATYESMDNGYSPTIDEMITFWRSRAELETDVCEGIRKDVARFEK